MWRPIPCLEVLLANFRDFHRTAQAAAALPTEPPQLSPRAAHLEMEGQTTHFSLGWPTVALQHPDLYALDVISDLLTNGDSSRLGSRLRIDQPLAVDVRSLSYTPSIAPGWFEISLECRPDQLEVCRRIVRDQVEQLQREPIADRELARVKRQKAAAHVFSLQTVQAQANGLAAGYLSTRDPAVR